jgi:hypothetical protein
MYNVTVVDYNQPRSGTDFSRKRPTPRSSFRLGGPRVRVIALRIKVVDSAVAPNFFSR